MINMREYGQRFGLSILLALILWLSPSSRAAESSHVGDTHYTPVGFFDIHVCNWPDRVPFFLLLFSTRMYAQVARIDVTGPDGRALHTFDLDRYKVIQKKGKPEKRVFINQLALPPGPTDGWYRARIAMTDGTVHTAEDYVIVRQMPRAQVVAPLDDADGIRLPVTLIWRAVPGARYYRVFVRDLWNDGKMVYESDVLSKPELRVPDGKLVSGGVYSWRVHARDVNEHVLLGDFNHGSQNEAVRFTVAE